MKDNNSTYIAFIFIVVVLILILVGDIVIIANNKENKEKIDNLTNTIIQQNEAVQDEVVDSTDENEIDDETIVVDGEEYDDEQNLYNATITNEN